MKKSNTIKNLQRLLVKKLEIPGESRILKKVLKKLKEELTHDEWVIYETY